MKLLLCLLACAGSMAVAVPTGGPAELSHGLLLTKDLGTATDTSLDPASNELVTRGEVLSFDLGNLKMNVGRISQTELYWKIFGAISDLTLDNQAPGQTTIKILKPCKGRTGTPDECWVDMKIWIERMYTDNTKFELLLQQTIASVVSRMVANPKNCWNYGRDEMINFGTYCNIGHSASVKIAGRGIDIRFESETDRKKWGHYDCMGMITPTNTALDEKIPEFESYLGVQGMGKKARCLDVEVTEVDNVPA